MPRKDSVIRIVGSEIQGPLYQISYCSYGKAYSEESKGTYIFCYQIKIFDVILDGKVPSGDVCWDDCIATCCIILCLISHTHHIVLRVVLVVSASTHAALSCGCMRLHVCVCVSASACLRLRVCVCVSVSVSASACLRLRVCVSACLRDELICFQWIPMPSISVSFPYIRSPRMLLPLPLTSTCSYMVAFDVGPHLLVYKHRASAGVG